MAPDRRILVYGPAYRDLIIETDSPLVAGEAPLTLDQSLPVARTEPRADHALCLRGPTGDALTFRPVPEGEGATYILAEPVLARRLGADTRRVVTGAYPIVACRTQLGGMGAGYAAALRGTLRAPLGLQGTAPDAVGRQVLLALQRHGIRVAPAYVPECTSDSSVVILSPQGDKLALGVRDAMVRWRAMPEDRTLVAGADALVFCGAPNALLADVLSWEPRIPVMCAPALRNVCDTAYPLAELAARIDYLTLNALEWAHLPDRAQVLAQVPVVSVTDGPRGSRVYCGGRDYAIAAVPFSGPADTNRAGETYGATFFAALLREASDFHAQRAVADALAQRAGELASRQAARQLALREFGFPDDDWIAATHER